MALITQSLFCLGQLRLCGWTVMHTILSNTLAYVWSLGKAIAVFVLYGVGLSNVLC